MDYIYFLLYVPVAFVFVLFVCFASIVHSRRHKSKVSVFKCFKEQPKVCHQVHSTAAPQFAKWIVFDLCQELFFCSSDIHTKLDVLSQGRLEKYSIQYLPCLKERSSEVPNIGISVIVLAGDNEAFDLLLCLLPSIFSLESASKTFSSLRRYL